MRRLIPYLLLSFIIMFSITFCLKTEKFNEQFRESDLLFAQKDSESLNNWFEEQEKKQEIYEHNRNEIHKDAGGVSNKPTEKEIVEDPKFEDIIVPEFKTGLEAFTFAQNALKIVDGVHIETSGKIVASIGKVTQKLKGIRKRDNDGNLYLLTSSYSAFAKIGFEVYYNQKQFKTRSSSNVNENLNVSFSDHNWQYGSLSAYERSYGVAIDDVYYIVNSDTVVKESNFKFENGLYSFDFELNPQSSTEKYKHQIKSTSNSKDFPVFDYVRFSVVIGEDGLLRTIQISERYKINAFGISATATGEVTETFVALNKPVSISVPSGF